VRLAIKARTSASGMLRSRAMRGTWNSAAAGEISGSRPEPDAVTKSTGIGAVGFSAWSFFYVRFYAINQLMICWTLVESSRLRCVVYGTGVGAARVEMAW
jgi:hypothetical protein